MAQQLLSNKTFIHGRITKKKLEDIIRLTAKKYGVQRVIFNNNAKYIRGSYSVNTKTIYIGKNQTKKDILITFFHELSHHVAVKTNKWKKYHLGLCNYMTLEEIFYIENQIDKQANKIWNKEVSCKVWGQYKYCYPKSKKTAIIPFLEQHL